MQRLLQNSCTSLQLKAKSCQWLHVRASLVKVSEVLSTGYLFLEQCGFPSWSQRSGEVLPAGGRNVELRRKLWNSSGKILCYYAIISEDIIEEREWEARRENHWNAPFFSMNAFCNFGLLRLFFIIVKMLFRTISVQLQALCPW